MCRFIAATYVYLLSLLLVGLVCVKSDAKKSSQRDVNDASESVDYTSLPKIPLFVIPNTPPDAENKVPVALYRGDYPASAYLNYGVKSNKQYNYGFYAPYKTSKVTPIHEPQNEGYVAAATEAPLYNSPDLYQRAEYDPAAYKLPVSNAAAASYLKYESAAKPLHTKYQTISNSNAYASLAPVYAYPPTDSAAVATPQAQTKKYTTYDPENNLQIQYVIKYVPVPYTVSSPSAAHQYAHPAPESAYITPKPLYTLQQKPSISVAQALPAASAGSYASSTENYADYAKYAESYTPTWGDEQGQYLLKSYSQPSYKNYDNKNVYSKKYSTPVSYVLASIGKSATTHYASSIRHESPEQHRHHHNHQENLYATKLAPVPLTVDKYTSQDNYKNSPVEDTKSYSDSEYSQPAPLYSLPAEIKYKAAFESTGVPASQLYSFEYGSPFQFQSSNYQKKDVSASVSGSASRTTEVISSTPKSR